MSSHVSIEILIEFIFIFWKFIWNDCVCELYLFLDKTYILWYFISTFNEKSIWIKLLFKLNGLPYILNKLQHLENWNVTKFNNFINLAVWVLLVKYVQFQSPSIVIKHASIFKLMVIECTLIFLRFCYKYQNITISTREREKHRFVVSTWCVDGVDC